MPVLRVATAVFALNLGRSAVNREEELLAYQNVQAFHTRVGCLERSSSVTRCMPPVSTDSERAQSCNREVFSIDVVSEPSSMSLGA